METEVVTFRIQRKPGSTVLDPDWVETRLPVSQDQLLGIAYFTYCNGQEFRLAIDGVLLEEWLMEYQEITGKQQVFQQIPTPEVGYRYCLGLVDNYIREFQIPPNAFPHISFDRLRSYLLFDTVAFLQGVKAATEWLSLPVHLDLYQVRELETGKLYTIRW